MTSMPRYRAQWHDVAALSPAHRAAMAALYLRCYDGSSDALFQRDLAAKDGAIVLWAGEALVGFTLVQSYPWQWRGQAITVVYSGDTLVAPEHWGQQTLALAWLEYVATLQAAQPERPLYWFLLVKGHRTYKYLSAFARQFHPHWQQAHPQWQALADALATARFGACYDAARGVVHFPVSQGHLKPQWAEPTAAPDHAATRFFMARNPGFRQGDELVCVCPLTVANMQPRAARVVAHVLAGGAAANLER